jgi:hypothetical protein
MVLLSLGVVSALLVKMLSISPVLPGTPGDCREEILREKETDVTWKQGCQALLLVLANW